MGFLTKKEHNPQTTVTRKKLVTVIVFGITFLIIEMLLIITDPILLIAKYYSRVDYGTYIHEALIQEIEAIHLSVYMFNVTNAERFQAGVDHKLKVEEIGPYTYREIRKNENIELDLKSNVIRYSPNVQTKFMPQKSVGRPEDVNVTMPNIAMLSMASKVGPFGLLSRMAYNLLTSQLKSKPIVRMNAKDYLWGYDEPLIRLGNTIMPGLVNFDVLGILDRLYDKKVKYRFELNANDKDKFSIKTVNGLGGLDKWGYKDPEKRSICNSFTNTYEGIAYPPEMTGDRPIRIYRGILCRFLEMDYHGKTMTPYGVEGLEYKISNRTYMRNEDTECLCNYGNCIDGISDLSPCFLGLPVVLSNAHFLHADPTLYERIDGLKPDEKRHGSSFVIEPKIGLVLDTQFSVQVNLLVRDVRFNSKTSPFSDMVIPVAYFTVTQPPLIPKQVHNLNLIYFIGPKLLLTVQILFGVLGLCLLAYAAQMLYWNWLFPSKTKNVLQSDIGSNVCVEPLMRR